MASSGSSKSIESICADIACVLEESIKRNLSEGLLLSGGLDTSILAGLAARWRKPDCITVALRGAPAPDIEYARQVAALFGLKHDVHYFDEEELEEGIYASITVLKTFDPMEVRNSAAAYVGLKTARNRGLKTVMTGDGGDELLAGYSFFFGLNPEQLDTALNKMWETMSFSSVHLAKSLGIEAKLPFLDPEFEELAKGLDASLKVKEKKGRTYGKWILRKAFEGLISPALAWREKAPLEIGTGTTILPSIFDSRISEEEFNRMKRKYYEKDKVRIRDKEQLYYYEIYRKECGIPEVKVGEGRRCPDCGAGVGDSVDFCRTCGAYPI
jgi:asparagine synthase (glutamine-hydrolysing)